MLDVYRNKCITQGAEIERLKQAMEDTLIGSVPATVATTKVAFPSAPSARKAAPATAPAAASIRHASQLYIDEIAEELESALAKNEQLERAVARLLQRLEVEEEWRAAAMEFMEMDTRIHKIIAASPKDRGSLSTKKEKKTRGSARECGSHYHQTLRDALAKTRCLEKSLQNAL